MNDQKTNKFSGEMRMVFIAGGFVFVGNTYRDENNPRMLRVENAYNCRCQSEGRGWGFVAKMGKTGCVLDSYSETPLDFHEDQLTFSIPLDASKWDITKEDTSEKDD